MNPPAAPRLDWASLDPEGEVVSLWPCLHDGKLTSCESDLLARTTTLGVRVGHLFDDDADAASVELRMHGVTSTVCTGWALWPGGSLPDPRRVGKEGFQRAHTEFRARCREESIGWDQFTTALAGGAFAIMGANLSREADGTFLLTLEGQMDGGPRPGPGSIHLKGSALTASRDGDPGFDLRRLLGLGRDYWNDFAATAPPPAG